jgi:hypothetical protein
MRKFNLLITITLLAFSFGCNQTTGKKSVQQAKTVNCEAEEPVFQNVESLLQKADSLLGKTVHVSGLIEHVCKHGGKRFKILSTDGSIELKIELGEEFGAVREDIVGNRVMVTGTLKSSEMDAKMVKAWEKKMKMNHAGEEDTEHYKQELAEIQEIHQKVISGQIPFYTMYSLQAKEYKLQN